MTLPVDKAAAAAALRRISQYLQLHGENAFKSRAYDVAADRILGLNEELSTLVDQGRLIELPGIGEAIAQKLTELVKTGHLAYLDQVRGDFPESILELLALADLGPKKVAALWRELKTGDLASLESACREGRVRGLKGFGAKTEAKILTGIERHKLLHRRRLLGEARPRALELLEQLRKAPGVVRAEVAGSLRRGCETVADVDLVISAPEAAPVLEALAQAPQVGQVLGQGENKCSVRLEPDLLQVDLRVLPDEDFATALHHLTGSKAHHIRLRGLAQAKGLKISEYGLFRGEQKLAVPDEEALYAQLGMQYVPPELREDGGEVEAALANQLPIQLLRPEDVQGVVHSHSTWSDGKNSLWEMALQARALGYRYLTVTEHSQAAHYAGGLTEEAIRRQWEEIDQLNARLDGFRLLKGIEADILEDGGLDCPEGVLAGMEVVIASVHVRHQMDQEQMTRRVLKALENPRTQILGHPTGRLIGSRDPYPLDMEAVLRRAAQLGVAVEVNGNPERLDLSASHVRLAVQRGTKLVVSSDAHSVDAVGRLIYAVTTARKGWVQRDQVLNTLPPDVFLRALRRPV